MGKKCSLKNCKNYYHDSSTFTFHELPRNANDKKRWLDAIPKGSLRENVKNIVICSAHFSPDNYQLAALGLTKRMLRKTATPNRFNSHGAICDSEKENNGQINKPTSIVLLVTPCSSENKTTTPLQQNLDTISCSSGNSKQPNKQDRATASCSSANQTPLLLKHNQVVQSNATSANQIPLLLKQNQVVQSNTTTVKQIPLLLEHNQVPTGTLLLVTPCSSENRATPTLQQNLNTISWPAGNSTTQSGGQKRVTVNCLSANQTPVLLKHNQLEIRKRSVDTEVQTTCRTGKWLKNCVREEELLKKIRALQSRLKRRDARISSMKSMLKNWTIRGSYKKGNIEENTEDLPTPDSSDTSDEDDENENHSLVSNMTSQCEMVWVKCRTCSKDSNPLVTTRITKKFLLGKTFKDVILLFVPQMANTIGVDDVICFNCSEILKSFAKFIIRCIAVEEVLKRADKQNKKILTGNKEVSRQTNNNSLMKNKSSEVYSEHFPPSPCNEDKNIGKLQVRQDLQKPCQPNFDPDDIISIHSDTEESDSQSVIEEIVVQFADMEEEPIPPVQAPYSNIDGVKTPYSRQKSTTNCEINSTVKPFDLSNHKEEIWVEPIQCSTDEMSSNSCDIPLPIDCINESTVTTKCKKKLPKEDETVPCRVDIFDSTTVNSSNNNLEICEEIEIITEEDNNDAINQTVSEEDDERFDNIEEGFVDFYPKKNNDRVISTTENKEPRNSSFPKTKKEKSSTVLSCPVCKINLYSASLYEKHMLKIHEDYKPYKCEKCDGSYKTKLSLDRHVQRYQKYQQCHMRKCNVCSELINWKDYLNHSKTHSKSFVCDQCGKTFLSANHLKYHSAKHQYKKESLQLCPICGEMKKKLAAHLLTHESGHKKFMCDKCPKLFKTKSHLNVHISYVHEESHLQCRECKTMFDTIGLLREHYRMEHSNNFPHVCEVCGKTFSRLPYLRKHVNIHLLNKKRKRCKYRFPSDKPSVPAKCKYCSKQFKTVYSLRVHILTHVKKLRYKCNYCSLTFGTYSNRSRHEKRHKRPHFELSCEVCFRRMGTKEELDEHMLSHEDKKKYICQHCGEPYARQYLLNHHISECHMNKEELEKQKEAMLADALEEFLL